METAAQTPLSESSVQRERQMAKQKGKRVIRKINSGNMQRVLESMNETFSSIKNLLYKIKILKNLNEKIRTTKKEKEKKMTNKKN